MQKFGVAPSGNFRDAERRALASASPNLSSVAIAEAKYAADRFGSSGTCLTNSGEPAIRTNQIRYPYTEDGIQDLKRIDNNNGSGLKFKKI
jgi:hypothetical protein